MQGTSAGYEITDEQCVSPPGNPTKGKDLARGRPAMRRRDELDDYLNGRNILSRAAVNNLGDMLTPCRTPLLMLILLLSLSRWTVTELLV